MYCRKLKVRSLLMSLGLGMAWCGAPPALAGSPAVGDWDVEIEMGERRFDARLSVTGGDAGLAAEWTSAWGEHAVSDVAFEDGMLTFKRRSTMGEQSFETTFRGTIEDDRLSGTFHSEWGDVSVTGSRAIPPLVGTWEFRSDTPRGSRVRKMVVHPDLTGSYETRGGAVPLQDLRVTGRDVTFRVTLTFRDREFESSFSGILEENTLRGTFTTSRGKREAVGRKLGGEGEPIPDPAEAFDALLEQASGPGGLDAAAREDAALVVQRAAEALPPEKLLSRLDRLAAALPDLAIPRPDRPLKQAQALDHAVLVSQVRALGQVPAERVAAHPAAEAFPGSVPEDAATVTRQVVVDTGKAGWHNHGIYGNPNSPYWHSTGLYAAPGAVVTVRMPEDLQDRGLHVRIGAHSDRLWGKSSWTRAPDICRRFPLTGVETRAANAFGGLVYIETPHALDVGEIELTVDGAVEAPHYILGKTDLEAWRATVRQRPAPWGELETDKVVLTLPSDLLRMVDDPESLMVFWDGIMDAYADLLGQPRQRRRAERFVPDTQISAGYMHSGYPLMTLLDITGTMVDRDRITANGHHGVWGLFHEVGHNHQRREWTFGGTTEVTVNLFSLYLMEHICGLTGAGHPSIKPEVRERQTRDYLAGGADFEHWKRDPFLALYSYMQLREAFGWEPFTRVFKEYRDLEEAVRPQSDDDKRDQWLTRFSQAVDRDLGPFCTAWGIPTGEGARAAVADLPAWMPENFPPVSGP